MTSETARDMMVLAVYVCGHHAAQRHELGTGRDGRREAARHEEAVQVLQQEARLGAQHAALRVEDEHPVREPGPQGGAAAGRQRRVPVGAAHAASQPRLVRALSEALAEDLPCPDLRMASPAFELGQGSRAVLR